MSVIGVGWGLSPLSLVRAARPQPVMGHGLSQEYSGGTWSLSGAAAHLLPINPPYGGLIAVSVGRGRSAKNTESAIIAPAAIMRIACCRISLMWASRQLRASLAGFSVLAEIAAHIADPAKRSLARTRQ
jgi:hypothetical protein